MHCTKLFKYFTERNCVFVSFKHSGNWHFFLPFKTATFNFRILSHLARSFPNLKYVRWGIRHFDIVIVRHLLPRARESTWYKNPSSVIITVLCVRAMPAAADTTGRFSRCAERPEELWWFNLILAHRIQSACCLLSACCALQRARVAYKMCDNQLTTGRVHALYDKHK